MTENEKARSDAGTPEQANESVSANTTFINQSNIKRRGVQAFLLEGEANAMPMCELARLVGVSERQVRKIIERERRNGSMILSSDNGSFCRRPIASGTRYADTYTGQMPEWSPTGKRYAS